MKTIIRSILINFFHLFKVRRNRIVFSNFFGRGFGDNPKYIALEIQRQKLPYDLYWLVNKNEVKSIPKGIKPIIIHTLKSFYIFATSRVIISNVKGLLPYKKKKNQYYIQTWHGSLILKYIEGETEGQLSTEYIWKSKIDSSLTDVILAASNEDKEVISKSFWYNHEIMLSGSPRSDIFFNTPIKEKENIKIKLGLDDGSKLLLYAPTFRDDKSSIGYGLDIHNVIDALEKRTGKVWKALIRLHPAALQFSNIFEYNDKIINASKYTDTQELCIICDAMITDYSSIMLDAFLQKKPVFLFTCDYNSYIANSRPMHDIYNKLPCRRNDSNKELIDNILNYKYSDYIKKLEHFMKYDFVSYDDGHACERVVNRIEEVIEKNYISPYIQ